MIDTIVARIREKSREDYEEMVFSGITDLRIWIQEHAERAALVFLAVGFLVPFLFRPILLLLGLAVLAAFVVWTVARPETGQSLHPSSGMSSGESAPHGGTSPEAQSMNESGKNGSVPLNSDPASQTFEREDTIN